jgi:hypothetical protein
MQMLLLQNSISNNNTYQERGNIMQINLHNRKTKKQKKALSM